MLCSDGYEAQTGTLKSDRFVLGHASALICGAYLRDDLDTNHTDCSVLNISCHLVSCFSTGLCVMECYGSKSVMKHFVFISIAVLTTLLSRVPRQSKADHCLVGLKELNK